MVQRLRRSLGSEAVKQMIRNTRKKDKTYCIVQMPDHNDIWSFEPWVFNIKNI